MNMAKRKYSKMKKIQPAVLRMKFTLPAVNPLNPTQQGVGYVDLSQCASLVNRRFYRQGLNWAVAGITLVDDSGSGAGTVTVQKLPSTWVTSNGWEKTFRAWMKMNNNALDEVPSVKPKYLDYKIHFDLFHAEDSSFDYNLLPSEYTGAVAEWNASRVHIPNSVVTNPSGTPGGQEAFLIHMCGNTGTDSKGIIEGYQDSRALPFSPDPNVLADTSTNWISAIFNEGNSQDNAVLNDLEDDFDEVPYDLERYPGGGSFSPNGEFVDTVDFTTTTVSGRNRIKPFNAPCGLIRFNNRSDADLTMYIDLVPGHHRGYLAEPMTEM